MLYGFIHFLKEETPYWPCYPRAVYILESMKQNIVSSIEKIYQTPQHPEIVEYELNTLVHHVGKRLSYVAAERDIRLNFTMTEHFTSIWGDIRLATSLLPMFMIKSLRYVQDGSKVEIRVDTVPEHWSITLGKVEIPDSYNQSDGRGEILLSAHEGKVEFSKEAKTVKFIFPVMPSFACLHREAGMQAMPADEEKRYFVFILAKNAAYGSFLKERLAPHYSVTLFHDKESMQAELHAGRYPGLILLEGGFADKGMEKLCRDLKDNFQTNRIRLIQLADCMDNPFPVSRMHSSLVDVCMERPCNLHDLRTQIATQLLLGEYTDKAYYKLLYDRDVSPIWNRDREFEEGTLFMRKVYRYIEENLFRSDLTVEEIAKEMGTCRGALCSRIKKITGNPPHQLIIARRIATAKELLRTGIYRVNEVAMMVGMSDIKNFCNVFKREVGTTPGEYMRRCKR